MSNGRVVAVVDDDELDRTLTANAIEDQGYEVVEAAAPEELDPSLGTFFAIVMDVKIADRRFGGIEYVIDRRRTGRLPPSTIVIFVSNFPSNTEFEKQLEQARPNHFFSKPIEYTQIHKILRRGAAA